MTEIEDWLKDPLREVSSGRWLRLKNEDERQNDLWYHFHFATRLKLDGADYFCRQVLGMASMPDTMGMPSLAYKLTEWYLDAFFFELMAAFDIVLQELNIVYAYDLGLKPECVRWNKKNKESRSFMDKLPKEIFNRIDEERKRDWFCKVQWYRNRTTHQAYVSKSRNTTYVGYVSPVSTYQVDLNYQDKAGQIKNEDITILKEYLFSMVNYISSIWGMMAQEFD